MKLLLAKLNKAIKDYALIEDGDKILIGLSGGKDSLALVELLSERAKVFAPRFSLVAAHISVENIPYQSDLTYLSAFAETRGVPFLHQVTSFDATSDTRKSPCFLCSWNRRKALFELAKQHGCNKIAFGHHQDDMLETLLMNQIFQGSYGTMPPKLQMEKFDMTIIRPLALIRESALAQFAEERGYHKQLKNCPFEQESHRPHVRRILEEMEQLNPHAASSLWNAMSHIQPTYLPPAIEKRQ